MENIMKKLLLSLLVLSGVSSFAFAAGTMLRACRGRCSQELTNCVNTGSPEEDCKKEFSKCERQCELRFRYD